MSITSLMTRVTRSDKARARAGHQPSLWDGIAWSMDNFTRVCDAKHIILRQTQAFSTMDVLVVQCGDAATIKVRASLEERQKIAATAHGLAHIALGHTESEAQSASCYWDPRIAKAVEVIPSDAGGESDGAAVDTDVDIKAQTRSREEVQAAVWAAHALVRPEIFAGHLNQLRAEGVESDIACKVAQVKTGNDLNIPGEVVERWLHHYDWQFPEPPAVWLEHDRKASADPNGQITPGSASAAASHTVIAEGE